MTTLFRGICTVSLVAVGLSVASCGLFKKGGDAADAEAEAAAVVEVAEAAPPAVVLPTAKNENDISRFPDEKKLDNVASTILRVANVREVPGTGKIVTTLAKGGTVTQIATRDKFALVVFTNPKDNATTMGWIPLDSFVAPPVVEAGIVAIKCTAPETAVISDVPFCGKICTADTDCPSGQACKGPTNRLLANGTKGDAAIVCTVFGAPKTPVADAAVAPVPPPPPPPPPPAVIPVPTTDVAPPVGGRCAVGFSLVAKDNLCHKVCVIGQCRTGTTFCINCGGVKVCSGNRDLCK